MGTATAGLQGVYGGTGPPARDCRVAGVTQKHDGRATKIGPAILVFLRGTKIPKRILVARVVRP